MLASKIHDIVAKSWEDRVLHANASTGRGIPQGERGVQFKEAIWKHGGVTEGMSKVRMRARGAICVVAALGAVNKGYCI